MVLGNAKQNNRVGGIPEDFPCFKEKAQSMKCLDANNYDYSKCQDAFANFKFCTGFWGQVKKIRKRYQVEPAMPAAEEREEIMKMFKSTGTIPDYSRLKNDL